MTTPLTDRLTAPDGSPSRVRRLQITAPGVIDLAEHDLPRPGPGQVHARTLLSGISHGTEMAWVRGDATALHRAWNPDLRVFTALPGRPYPVEPGYETVAEIADLGDGVTGLEPGDLVYLDRPHATAHLVDAAAALAGRIPDRCPPERAVFWPLARVALGGVHDADIQVGDNIAVIGLGVVGLLAAQLARSAGAGRVIGVDRYPRRLEAAARHGAAVVGTTSSDVTGQIRDLTGGHGVDVAIEVSGSYVGLQEAIRACRVAGRVVTVASYHGDQTGLRLGEEYHRNRISLLSSMTVNGCPQRHSGWDLDRLNATARALIIDHALDVDGLITHRIPFDQAADAYKLIAQHPQDTIKVVLTDD